MARTKASVGAKVSVGKSSKARCSAAPTINNISSVEKSSRSYSGGNPVCPREIPTWQKPITTFVSSKPKNIIEDSVAASSSKPKRKIIYSDDEGDLETNNKETEINVDIEKDDEMEINEVLVKATTNVENPGDSQVNRIECQDYDLIESPPKNRELEESIILQPLTGEDSHKMEEYFPKTPKKSNGVKKSNKENLNMNKLKRSLDDAYEEPSYKKIRAE